MRVDILNRLFNGQKVSALATIVVLVFLLAIVFGVL